MASNGGADAVDPNRFRQIGKLLGDQLCHLFGQIGTSRMRNIAFSRVTGAVFRISMLNDCEMILDPLIVLGRNDALSVCDPTADAPFP